MHAYIRGTIAGVDFLLDPANKDEAIAILRKHLPQMSEHVAAQSYALMAGPKGFTPKAALNPEGVRKVLELRGEYGEPRKGDGRPDEVLRSDLLSGGDALARRRGLYFLYSKTFLVVYRRALPWRVRMERLR